MPRRRGRGEGSIFKRSDGKWAAEVSLGHSFDGKRRRKTIYGRTRKEVHDKLLALQQDIGTGLAEPSRMTVGQYLQHWLDSAAAHTVRPVTLAVYRQYVRLYADPWIGHIPLSKLQPLQLQQLYTERLQAGLSRRTVQYVHAILRRSFNQAVKWGMIPRNPTAAVDAPRPTRREMQVLTPQQVEQLVQTMTGDPYFALYYLAIATGCRRGELVALRWADVDWRRPSITINRTAEEVKGKAVFTEPKTARSKRLIPLPEEAVSALAEHKRQQDQAREDPDYEDHDLVFCQPNGQPLRPGYVTEHFLTFLRRAQLPRIRLHDLRHTHATMLLAAGVHPKIVSERLGHSTISLTLDTYSHVLPTMQDEVTRKLDALLPKAPT